MLNVIGLDVETSVFPFAHPWQKDAVLVAVGIAKPDGTRKTWLFNHNLHQSTQSQREMIAEIQSEIDKADLLVGHNIKFDLNWMRYIGINFEHCRTWCTQVVEYLLRGQRIGALRLSDLSKQYLSIDKIDKVSTFWEAGWATEDIPTNILLPYLEQDCINALAIYQRQLGLVKAEGMEMLALVQNGETIVLSEIECNGVMWNQAAAGVYEKDLREQVAVLDTELKMAFGFDCNMNSKDELSVALYGGILKVDATEWVIKEFKEHSTYKERKIIREEKVEGIGFTPPKGSELKKSGYFSTDKGTLNRLTGRGKMKQDVKKWLIERSAVSQAVKMLSGDGSNGKGLINKVQSDGRIHPSLNQTIAKTGRLTSSDPEHHWGL